MCKHGYKGYIAPALGLFPSEVVLCDLEDHTQFLASYNVADLHIMQLDEEYDGVIDAYDDGDVRSTVIELEGGESD